MNDKFLEFNLFSETRFMEYSYRTYDHFIRMYHILIEKLKRDEETNKENDEEEVSDIQNLLAQLELVIDLLFMAELSHLITFCSKEFQRFDVLPFHAMNTYLKLNKHLYSARQAFSESKVPKVVYFHKTEKLESYSVRHNFGIHVDSVIETQSFGNAKLLVRSERGRVTRSRDLQNISKDKEGFRSIICKKYKGLFAYIDTLISLPQ